MSKTNLISAGFLALVLSLPGSPVTDRAQAQAWREPLACMNLALDFAAQLTGLQGIDDLLETQREALESLNAVAADETEPPGARLQAARSLMGSRAMRDHERAVRRVQRMLDAARSTVAGWRGLYCPVATPTGDRGLSGQARCDALSATFVDRLRIDQRSPEQTRAREALETERQTILKLRITRSDRNDLLDLWRIRSEAFDALHRLERVQFLQSEAEILVSGVEEESCAELGQPS